MESIDNEISQEDVSDSYGGVIKRKPLLELNMFKKVIVVKQKKITFLNQHVKCNVWHFWSEFMGRWMGLKDSAKKIC